MSVTSVIQSARNLQRGELLGDREKVISNNTITGLSINLPIMDTCRPSRLCVQTCYAARPVPIALPAAIKKQLRTLNSMRADPQGTAGRIVGEMIGHMRRGALFLRWNGVGDLFPEAVECMHAVAEALPALKIWCVTRRPDMAALVRPLPNLFLHFSLDRESLDRHARLMALKPTARLFFSYQAAPDEARPPAELRAIHPAVYFTDQYKAHAPPAFARVSCPLNGKGGGAASALAGACLACARCWSGEALTPAPLADDTPDEEGADDEQLSLF